MAQQYEEAPESLRLPQELDFKPVSISDDASRAREQWLPEALANFTADTRDMVEVRASNSPPPQMGMKTQPIDLFEGPSRCSCCINWVRERPDDVKENLEETDEVKQHAIVVRRKKSHQKYSREPLEIDSIVVNSPLIRAALKKVFSNCPSIDIEARGWTFEAPFQLFFHYWDEINRLLESGDPNTSQHMKVLCDVLSPVLEEALTLSKNLISRGLISFEPIWTLFKPGQNVYYNSKRKGDPEYLLDLDSCEYKEGREDRDTVYSLICTMVDWDGNSFGRRSMSFSISQFDGSKGITELFVYPLKFCKDIAAVEERFLKRGRRFEELATITYAYYGMARRRQQFMDIEDYESEALVSLKSPRPLLTSIGCNSQLIFQPQLYERVMIDTRSFYRKASEKLYLNPLNTVSKRQVLEDHRHYESDSEDTKAEKKPLTDPQCMNCSPWLKGYAFQSKQWVSVLVDGVTEICWNNDAFDNLVLNRRYKDLIRGFVQSRVKKLEAFDDFIDGKGRGIVMLLAGPPGVGKTLTAEAAAEVLHAPLYSLSAGQLGIDAHKVEKRLQEVLQLSTTWGAVLLLDEADVFLEQRTIHDLERNSLVSIFLRTLEYFEGVLFLTTNRLSAFDSAFESRIDFNLSFPALDYHSRLIIWKNLFAKVKLPVNLQEADYEELAHVDLNGRRIKNIIKSAAVIAGNEDESVVRRAHVDTILDVFAPKS